MSLKRQSCSYVCTPTLSHHSQAMNKNTFFKWSISGAEGSAHTKRATEERRDGASLLEEPPNVVCQFLPDKCCLWSIFSFAKPSVFTAADGMCMYGGASCVLAVLSVDTYKKKHVALRDSSVSVLWNISEASAERPVAQWKMAFKWSEWVRPTSADLLRAHAGALADLFIFVLEMCLAACLRVTCDDNSVLIKLDRADC